jgi:dTDP-glucose 4,6-dehydratase
MERVLITGSLGALGTVLTRELRARGYDVWGCDLAHNHDPQYHRCDIAEYRQIKRVMDLVRPNLVYHFAAEFGRVNGDEFAENLWKSNTLGLHNVINLCNHYRSHLVFASSSEAYGMLADKEVLTESILDTCVPEFHNEYALSKWTGEHQVRIGIRRGLSATILRFFNAYGHHEFYSPYRSVVCLFIYRLLHSLPITVYHNYRRTFLYVDDWANTVANLADCYQRLPNGVAINVAGEESYTVEELKDMILDQIGGLDSAITYLDKEAANVTDKRPDNTRAKLLLNHNPVVGLAEGLAKTIAWQREVYKCQL